MARAESLSEATAQPPRRPAGFGRRVVKAFVALATLYLLVVGAMMFFEESLVFFPSKYPSGNWQPTGFPWEEAVFQAADGTKLHGWYVPHPRPRAVVLFCHGNAGHLAHRAYLADILHRQVGVSVLLFDYRGYGRSEGKPNEKGVLADARAARTWLAKKAGVKEKDIVLMGESLGGAVAVDLAANDGAKALVLESTFTSLPDAAAYHYPWAPVRWLMRTRLDSLSKIAAYRGPLLQCHGDADTIVPFAQGRRLFEKANRPKQFITLSGKNHNDFHDADYYEALGKFLDGVK